MQARNRLRKVKEAARTCAIMNEDKLLSRNEKKVYSTERHSLVIEDNVSLIKDKGEKLCDWSLEKWNAIAPIESFKFYIDEYKEIIYPYTKNADGSVTVLKVPLVGCSLENKVVQQSFEFPKCDKPKKTSKKKKKKKVA